MRLLTSQICHLYVHNRYSCVEIARIDGRSETTIYCMLKDNGVQIRDRSEANQTFSNVVLIKLYNMGLSCPQIGKLLGIHPSTVVKRFKLINFPLRDRKMAGVIRYTNKEFRKHFCSPGFLKRLAEVAI